MLYPGARNMENRGQCSDTLVTAVLRRAKIGWFKKKNQNQQKTHKTPKTQNHPPPQRCLHICMGY